MIALLFLEGMRMPRAGGKGRPDTALSRYFSAPWVQVAEKCAFSVRDTAEPAVFQEKMWLSNGYCEGGVLVRDLWQSRDGAHWIRVSGATPYDGYSEMVVHDGKLWAVKASVWNSSDGLDWQLVCPQTPFGARGYGELVVFQGAMWQLGSGPDVWRCADGVNWQCALKRAPYGDRYGAAVAAYDGRLWLMGGATTQENSPPERHYPQYTTHRDVWCSEDGVHWSRVLEHAPWQPRMWCVAEVYAGELWVIGGFSNREDINFAEAWHTRDGSSWGNHRSEPMFSARHEVTPYVHDGSLWVVAGNSWPLTNDAWRLTLGANG